MRLHNWLRLALLLAGVLVMDGAGQAVTGSYTAIEAAEAPPPLPVADHWPPFVMVYQVTEFDWPAHKAPRVAHFTVEWTDRHHYRRTELDDSDNSPFVGTVWEQNGAKQTMTRAGSTPVVIPRVSTLSQILPTPNEFLTPEFFVPEKLRAMVSLPERPVISLGDGHTRFAWTVVRGSTERAEVTYRDSDTIPILYRVFDDGVEIRRYEVLKLEAYPSGTLPGAARLP